MTSNEIGVALEAAEKTEATINDTRQRYTPYPERGSTINPHLKILGLNPKPNPYA